MAIVSDAKKKARQELTEVLNALNALHAGGDVFGGLTTSYDPGVQAKAELIRQMKSAIEHFNQTP